MTTENNEKKDVNYWWYALPVVLAMVVGLAIQKDVPVMAVVPFLFFVTALAIAFYMWNKDKDSNTG